MDSLIGTRLGSYEVIAMLGSGGMGAVYRARDTRLNRVVAIKVVEDQFEGRRDGSELLYRSPDGTLMSVPVQPSGDSLVFGSATPLLTVRWFYDVSPDGQRVLVASPVEQAGPSPLIVTTKLADGAASRTRQVVGSQSRRFEIGAAVRSQVRR